MNKLDPVCEKLGFSSLDDVEQLKELQKKTNIAPRHMAVIALVLLLVMMVLEYGASILCQVIGFVYPAYMSFKAIESKAEDDDKQWLTYWVVYCTFTLLDMTFGFILHCIPFYNLIKLCILVFLFHPTTQGATTVYNSIVRPFLIKNQAFIDSKIDQVVNEVDKQATQGITQGTRIISQASDMIKQE